MRNTPSVSLTALSENGRRRTKMGGNVVLYQNPIKNRSVFIFACNSRVYFDTIRLIMHTQPTAIAITCAQEPADIKRMIYAHYYNSPDDSIYIIAFLGGDRERAAANAWYAICEARKAMMMTPPADRLLGMITDLALDGGSDVAPLCIHRENTNDEKAEALAEKNAMEWRTWHVANANDMPAYMSKYNLIGGLRRCATQGGDVID